MKNSKVLAMEEQYFLKTAVGFFLLILSGIVISALRLKFFM